MCGLERGLHTDVADHDALQVVNMHLSLRDTIRPPRVWVVFLQQSQVKFIKKNHDH